MLEYQINLCVKQLMCIKNLKKNLKVNLVLSQIRVVNSCLLGMNILGTPANATEQNKLWKKKKLTQNDAESTQLSNL